MRRALQSEALWPAPPGQGAQKLGEGQSTSPGHLDTKAVTQGPPPEKTHTCQMYKKEPACREPKALARQVKTR